MGAHTSDNTTSDGSGERRSSGSARSPARKPVRKAARRTSGRAAAGRQRASTSRAEALRAAAESGSDLPHLINLLANYVNESMRDDLRRFGMTIPRWTVLRQLGDDGRAMGELARACWMPQSSLSRVVDQMERDGLVARRPSRRDSRVVEVRLTAEGRELAEQVVPDASRRAHASLRDRISNEADALGELLERVMEAVRGESAPPGKQRRGTTGARELRSRRARRKGER